MPRKVYESSTVKRTADAVLVVAALSAGPLVAQTAEQHRPMVTGVHFDGNRAIEDLVLAASIATTASAWSRHAFLLGDLGFGERREFDETEFRRDVVRLQLLYRQHGFYEARVDTTVRRRDRSVDVTFLIEEGPPVVVESIEVGGVEGLVDSRRLLRRLPLRSGAPFNRLAFEAAADTILFTMRDLGYAFAEVFRNYTVDRIQRRARVSYEVFPGERVRVGEIVIEGARTVSSRTVRRNLAFTEGSLFRQRDLVQSQLSLYQSDLFRYASVGLHSDSLLRGSDSLARVRVRVTESPRERARLGAGYGTIDCLRGSATFTRANFLGGARRLDIAARVSRVGASDPTRLGLENSICSQVRNDLFADRVNHFASITLTQPSLVARTFSASLSGFTERRTELNAYERTAVGGAASIGFRVGRTPVSLTWRVTRARTAADPATFCIHFDRCEESTIAQLSDYRREAALVVQAVDSRTNSPVDPSSGRVTVVALSHASPAVWSQVGFNKLDAESSWYRLLSRGFVLALRLRGGVVRALTTVIADSAIRFVPQEERFYAGGPTTVRGFPRNEMGPVVYVADSLDQSGDPVNLRSSPLGSSAIVLGNLELRMPSPILPGRLGFSLFVDAGELWEEAPEGLVAAGLKITPGAGMRLLTPLGPMRLDVAFNGYLRQAGRLYLIDRATGNLVLADLAYRPRRGTSLLHRLQLHFSVGNAF